MPRDDVRATGEDMVMIQDQQKQKFNFQNVAQETRIEFIGEQTIPSEDRKLIGDTS